MKRTIFLFILFVFAKPMYSQAIDLGQSISPVQDSLAKYHIPFDTINLGEDRKGLVIKIKKKEMFGLSGDEYIEFGASRIVRDISWYYDDTATVSIANKFSWNVRKRLYDMKAPELIKEEGYLLEHYWNMGDRKAMVMLNDKGDLHFNLWSDSAFFPPSR